MILEQTSRYYNNLLLFLYPFLVPIDSSTQSVLLNQLKSYVSYYYIFLISIFFKFDKISIITFPIWLMRFLPTFTNFRWKNTFFKSEECLKKVCKNNTKSHIFGRHGTRRRKMTWDRSSSRKIAPKHENLVNYMGFWGFRRALHAPRRRPGGPRQALWGSLGASRAPFGSHPVA